MNTPQSFTPPRGNLDPEPWPNAEGSAGVWILGLSAVLMLVTAIVVLKRKKLPKQGREEERPPVIASWPAAAEEVRRRSADRFGGEWAAKTTEEVVSELESKGVLNSDQLARIEIVGKHADLIKFANAESLPLTLEETFWLDSILKALAKPIVV